MFSLEKILNTSNEWLSSTFNPTTVIIIQFVAVALFAITLFALLGLSLVLMERKVAAYMQLRLGPNRVGPKGMFQTVADTVKLVFKESLTDRKSVV